MIRKCLVLVAVSLFLAGTTFAEPQRASFVKENRMPALHKAEVGVVGQYVEVPDDYAPMGNGSDNYTASPYVRYGLTDILAVQAEVPFKQVSPSLGDDEQGLGDAVLGAELVAFQDLFSYPYIIPHVELSLDTGDEDKGMGNGKSLLSAGVSVGTVVKDMFHYVIDGRYTFKDEANDGSGDDLNVLTIAGAFIWDLSDQFSLIAEAKGTNNKDSNDDIPMYFQGGFGMQATENVYFTVLAGSAKNTDADVLVSGKLSYSF